MSEMIESLASQVKLDEANLESLLKGLERARTRYEKAFEATREGVETSRLTIKKLEETLQGCRESLKIANEVVIPALIAANETFQNTWDAQSSLQVMRATAIRETPDEES